MDILHLLHRPTPRIGYQTRIYSSAVVLLRILLFCVVVFPQVVAASVKNVKIIFFDFNGTLVVDDVDGKLVEAYCKWKYRENYDKGKCTEATWGTEGRDEVLSEFLKTTDGEEALKKEVTANEIEKVKTAVQNFQKEGWQVAVLSDSGPKMLEAIFKIFGIEVDQIWGQASSNEKELEYCDAKLDCVVTPTAAMKVGVAKKIVDDKMKGNVSEWSLVDNSLKKFGGDQDLSSNKDLINNGEYVDEQKKFRLYYVDKSVAQGAGASDKGWKPLQEYITDEYPLFAVLEMSLEQAYVEFVNRYHV
jgi:hypothetical protein